MTDYDEQLAADRVIEALGREPKSVTEMIRECEVGQTIPLECFAGMPAHSERVKVPIIDPVSVMDFNVSFDEIVRSPPFKNVVFERQAGGWRRME